MNKRIAWIDVARGIGIILVVYGHVARGLLNAGITGPKSPLSSLDYTIYSFHMPLFLFMAGLNVRRSLSKGAGRFFKSKILTIAYPYLLWSFIQGSLEVALASHLNNPVSRYDVMNIPWRPIKQFWFFFDLFLFHMVAIFTANRRAISALLFVLAFAFGFFIGPRHVWYTIYLWAFVFYEAGILLDVRTLEVVQHVKPLALPVLGALFAVAVYYSGPLCGYDTQSKYALPASVLGISFTIALCKLIVDWSASLTRLFTEFGVASTTIYILHVLAGAGTRVILRGMGVHNVAVQLSLGVLLGLGVPMLIYYAAVRLGIIAYLGLGIQPRPANDPASRKPPGTPMDGAGLASPVTRAG
ncbi:MAG TPA: acyltransferase [Acidisarcina sp.]